MGNFIKGTFGFIFMAGVVAAVKISYKLGEANAIHNMTKNGATIIYCSNEESESKKED